MHLLVTQSLLNCCCRWTVGDASIFSVDDGKRLAQTPHKPLTFYERVRLEKQAKASLETPLVQGYRLLPEFTPGRAMFWGSIIAVWGTAALVMTTALDIKTVSTASLQKSKDVPVRVSCSTLSAAVSVWNTAVVLYMHGQAVTDMHMSPH